MAEIAAFCKAFIGAKAEYSYKRLRCAALKKSQTNFLSTPYIIPQGGIQRNLYADPKRIPPVGLADSRWAHFLAHPVEK